MFWGVHCTPVPPGFVPASSPSTPCLRSLFAAPPPALPRSHCPSGPAVFWAFLRPLLWPLLLPSHGPPPALPHPPSATPPATPPANDRRKTKKLWPSSGRGRRVFIYTSMCPTSCKRMRMDDDDVESRAAQESQFKIRSQA